MPVDTQLSVARSGHTATLLPHNGAVLVAGGTAADVPVTDVDLFLPAMFPDPYSWGMGSFAPAAPLAGARSHAVAGPAGDDGYAFVAGGGVPVGEAYAFTTLKTDKDDYAPGEQALITGSGWQTGEEVGLVFQEDPAVHPDYTLTLIADGDGNISHDEWAPEQHDLNVRFYLMATGQQSMRRAQTTFTDAFATNTAIVSSANPSIVGNSVTFTATVKTGNTPGSGTPVTVGTVKFGTGNNCTGGFTAFSVSSTLLTLNASGQASYAHTFTTTTGSPFTVRACYIGTGGSTGSQDSDASLSQTVNAATGPTKLAITSVNGGSNPTYGNTFSVVVQSQNASSLATNVTANTNFTLIVATGTGTIRHRHRHDSFWPELSYGDWGHLLQGRERCDLTATRTSGDTLTAGTSALFNVLARPITVTADAKSKVYGDADPALTFTTSSLGSGAAVTGALARVAGENVGSHAITQGTVTDANNPNYVITFVGANLTITARPVTVTADAKSKVYGDADPALTFTTSSLGSGAAVTGALARVAGETVAGSPYAITQGTVTDANNPNYVITFVGANLTITARPVTVTADAKSKVYGDADPALTFTTSSLGSGAAVTGALARVAGETVAGAPTRLRRGR